MPAQILGRQPIANPNVFNNSEALQHCPGDGNIRHDSCPQRRGRPGEGRKGDSTPTRAGLSRSRFEPHRDPTSSDYRVGTSTFRSKNVDRDDNAQVLSGEWAAIREAIVGRDLPGRQQTCLATSTSTGGTAGSLPAGSPRSCRVIAWISNWLSKSSCPVSLSSIRASWYLKTKLRSDRGPQ